MIPCLERPHQETLSAIKLIQIFGDPTCSELRAPLYRFPFGFIAGLDFSHFNMDPELRGGTPAGSGSRYSFDRFSAR